MRVLPEINREQELVINKSLKNGAKLDIQTAGGLLRIRPEQSSPTGLVAEALNEGLLTGSGAVVSTIELQPGENTIYRHGAENDIQIRIPATSEEATLIEVSQPGASLKEINT